MLTLPPALRQARFSRFWVGLVFAWTGYLMQQWTLLWHIRTLTPEPLALGAVGLVRVIAILACSLFAGILADLLNRRKVVILTQTTMGLVSLALGWLTWSGGIQLWHIYLLVGVQAIAFSFDLPARQSLVPNLVPARDLQNAFSLEGITYQIGAFAGSTLGGLLIDRLGITSAYISSALSFAPMVLGLLSLGEIAQEPLNESRKKLAWREVHATIREGIAFTFRQPLILSGMLLDFLATFFVRADTLMPIIARDVLGVGAVAYGWLSAAQSIGATFAGMVMSFIREMRHQGAVLLGSVVMFGAGAILLGTSRSFPLAMLGLMIAGASDAVSAVIRNTIRQLHTPDRMRGRMTSVNQIFFMGGPQLGEVKSGLLGGWIGVPATIALGGVACILSVGWVARRWPQLRGYNGHEPAQALQEA